LRTEETARLDDERGTEELELGTSELELEELRIEELERVITELATLAVLEVVTELHTDPVMVGTWALPEPLLP
jgi:hypothetical protein